MLFKPGTSLYAYEVIREAGTKVLYVNYMGANFVPSIAENAEVMARAIDLLIETPGVARIVFVQQRNYSYDTQETFMLQEIANLYVYLTKQEKILSPSKLSILNKGNLGKRYNDVGYLLITLKRDPIMAFIELKKLVNLERANLEKIPESIKIDQLNYVKILENFYELLKNTELIRKTEKYLDDYKYNRGPYYSIFRPEIIPNFTFTRLVSSLPEEAEILDQYVIGEEFDKSNVTILKRERDAKPIYHLMPPEYSLEEGLQELLNLARNVLIEHQPKAEEFTDPEKTRQVFLNVSRDLLRELAESKKIKLDYADLNKLANILVRHTIGFGLIEVLLQDKNLQDIVLNAPISLNPVFLRHQEYDECMTNIIPSREDADSWAAKFRMISGRPLDEANPILDTDLALGNITARVAVIQQPLSPGGLAYAIRRHREAPWTLPLFIKNKMINSFSAGLLSFFIDGARTMLVAGTRSSGKCVDGNTLIQLSDGNIISIKDLVGEKKRDIDDGIIFNPKSNFYVKSLNDMSIKNNRITDVWKRKSPEKVIKIKTRSGKEIITTREHPYFIYKGGLKNKRADELNKGDLIASPRKIDVEERNVEIDLRNHPRLIEESDDFYVLKGRTNSSVIKFPKKITQNLAEFIGMVIGDGHLDLPKLEFHNSCKELRERYISLLKIFGVKYREFKSRNTFVVQVTSRVLNRLLNRIFEIPFGKKSDKVIIPRLILKSDNKILSSFIRGYFDCDGYTPKNKRDLELATASKIMSEHLRLALLRFGITCFVKPKKVNGVDYYRILIRGSFVENFAREIGFFHPMKKARLTSIANTNYIQNSNVDIIPDGNLILKELRKKLRISPKNFRVSGKDYWAYENNQYKVTKNWFKKIINFYKQRYEELYSLEYQAESLKKIANFDLRGYIEKLEKLRKLAGVSYVYIASHIGMSEAGVRKSLQLQRTNDLTSLNKLSRSIEIIERENLSQQTISLLNELSYERIMINSVSIGIILSNMRKFLNVSNEEFLSEGISIGSISNFFNGVYTPSFKVLQSIVKKIIEIFNSTFSREVEGLILEAEKLANSDLFWDEIVSSEEINKVDDFVYDLTVEDTHNFVANGLIAHNTSLLGSLMLEIMPKYRIVVLEDSVIGDSKIIIKENGQFKKTTIGELIDKQIKENGFVDIDEREKSSNPNKIKIFSVNKNGKIVLAEVSKFIKHKVNKPIYEIKTTSGKKIKVTEDHSLFTLDEKNIFKPVKCKDLIEGSFIAIPLKLQFDNSLECINLLENLDKLNKKIFVFGEGVKDYIINNRNELFSLAYSLGYVKPTIQNWTVKKILPIKIFDKVKNKISKEGLFIKSEGCSRPIFTKLGLDENFLNFVGLWLADGCYDKNSVIISVVEEENREVVRIVADKLGIPVKMHTDGFSLMLNSVLLKEIMQKILELNGNSYTKKIPNWCYNLSNGQVGWLLRGFFSGDGCVSDKEIIFSICSKELIGDITSLLLRFNIISRNSHIINPRDKTIGCRIGNTKMLNSFKDNVGFLVNSKQEKLEKLCSRISTHDTSDVIPLSLEVKYELNDILGKNFNKSDYITRQNNIGRKKLRELLEMVPIGITNPIDPLRDIVKSDIFWDKVKSIDRVSGEEFVYDISIPEYENFICENIIAHNTLELPVDAIRKLNYDILRMKVRGSLLKESAEVSADEGIRTSLRLGDSSLIVGEVRSLEAKALYEAMRVGALANVVAGTIHGASPYGVFDRVVNDLGVPTTSFKATDCIIVANPVKTPDGLRSMKRVIQLTEVRKHWLKDPEEEGGFVDLLKYNVDSDSLEPTAELINGDSEAIKSVASTVKGWAGNWDAVYDNILLRAKIKQEIVDLSERLNIPEILEAEFNSLSNNMFHQFSKEVQEEIGLPESNRVFPLWQAWVKKEIKGRRF